MFSYKSRYCVAAAMAAMAALTGHVEARDIDLQSIGGAGGKTGSAEAILKNTRTIHGWFAGFYPEKNPQYVITAIIEEGKSGSKSAAPIFEKIAKELNKIYP